MINAQQFKNLGFTIAKNDKLVPINKQPPTATKVLFPSRWNTGPHIGTWAMHSCAWRKGMAPSNLSGDLTEREIGRWRPNLTAIESSLMDETVYLVKGNPYTGQDLKSVGWQIDDIVKLCAMGPLEEFVQPTFITPVVPVVHDGLAAGDVVMFADDGSEPKEIKVLYADDEVFFYKGVDGDFMGYAKQGSGTVELTNHHKICKIMSRWGYPEAEYTTDRMVSVTYAVIEQMLAEGYKL